MTTHFQLFDLPENATEEQIRTRYKQLAARCHPDKGGSSQLMFMIKNSYQKLIIGEGALPVNQQLDDSNKQIIDLKKTIHQQQFYIQKLSVAIAKQAQQKETKRLKKILMPALLGILSLFVIVLAGENYQMNKQVKQLQVSAANKTIMAPNLPNQTASTAEPDQNEIWELKQKLRLSRAMQQYLETDLDTSLAIIQHQLSDTAAPLSQAQLQFLAQYELELNKPSISHDSTVPAPIQTEPANSETYSEEASQRQGPTLQTQDLNTEAQE